MNKALIFALFFFFVCSSFITVFSSTSVLGSVEDSWYTITPMTQTRPSSGVVALDGKIYAIGGSTLEASILVLDSIYLRPIVGTNECYDPKTGKWTTLSSMPTPRESLAIVVCEGKIYCIGGIAFAPDQTKLCYSDANEVYDPVTDSWSSKASFPINDLSPQVYVVDGKLFAITRGGALYVYDPVTDSWSSKTSLPSKYGSPRYVVGRQLLAITGGKLYAYDSTTDVWINKADMSLGSEAFLVVMDNKIIIGEYLHKQVYSVYTFSVSIKVMIYDLLTDTWSEGKTSPEPALYIDSSRTVGVTTGVYAPKNIYVFGAAYDELYANGQGFTWVYDPVGDVWSTAKAMPQLTSDESRFVSSILVVDDVLYLIGGTVNKQYIPIGYGTLSPTSSPPTTLAPSDSLVFSKPEFSGLFTSFLNNPITVVAIVLIIGIVVGTLFFLLFRRKK